MRLFGDVTTNNFWDWIFRVPVFKNGRPTPGDNNGTGQMNIFQTALSAGQKVQMRKAAILGGAVTGVGVVLYHFFGK